MAKAKPAETFINLEDYFSEQDEEGNLVLKPKAKGAGAVDLRPVLAKLEALDKRLDKLELIESHLLDILIPGRKQFQKRP